MLNPSKYLAPNMGPTRSSIADVHKSISPNAFFF